MSKITPSIKRKVRKMGEKNTNCKDILGKKFRERKERSNTAVTPNFKWRKVSRHVLLKGHFNCVMCLSFINTSIPASFI